MNVQPTLDPAALGRILLLQSTLPVATDENRLMEMVAYGMSALPGVAECLVCIEGTTVDIRGSSRTPKAELCAAAVDDAFTGCADSCPVAWEESWHRIVLRTSRRDYGSLFLNLEDSEVFEPYSAFANNTANLVALHIENDRTAAELNALNRGLDQQVRDRTQQLQASETHLREAQKVARIGSFEGEIANNSLWWSEELYLLFGLDPEHFAPTKEHFGELLHPEDKESYLAAISESLELGKDLKKTFRAKHTSGEWRHYETTAKVSKNNKGAVIGLRGTVQDITERKLAEAEKKNLQTHLRHSQKMDAVGQLAAGVAHEFNNILVGILGNADLLLLTTGDDLPENYRQPIKDIERAGTRAADLTKQLLSFARKKSPDVSLFDVNRVISDHTGLLRRLVHTNIELQFHLASDPLMTRADESNVEQAITNLVLNARDAMPNGGTLTVQTDSKNLAANEVAPSCQPGDYARLSVIDEGCGITPEDKERIFEPFFTTKQIGKGTGLGLSTVFADVKSNGGFITVESCVGHGTTFCIHLPQVEETTETTVTKNKHTSPLDSGNETILVCDDEDIVLRSVSALLNTFGYTVICAHSPHEAIDIAKTHAGKISLLLTDFAMPEMDGLQLSEQITQLLPEIKIIVTSGYAEDVSQGDQVDKTHFEFIQKPAPYDLLSQTIRKVLDDGTTSKK